MCRTVWDHAGAVFACTLPFHLGSEHVAADGTRGVTVPLGTNSTFCSCFREQAIPAGVAAATRHLQLLGWQRLPEGVPGDTAPDIGWWRCPRCRLAHAQPRPALLALRPRMPLWRARRRR